MVLWDVATGRRLAENLPVKEGYIEDVLYSPNGKVLAAAYKFGPRSGVLLWDAATREPLGSGSLPIDNKGGSVKLAFSSDSKILAGGYEFQRLDGGCGVVLWEVATGKRLAEDPLVVQAGKIGGIAFGLDNKILAVGYGGYGGGSGVVLWDMATCKRLAENPLVVQEGDVSGVAFSSDGKTLVAGYRIGVRGGGVVLWDTVTRKRLIGEPLAVKEGYVVDVAFNPDGKSLATVYNPGGVVLWNVDLRSWQCKAGEIANRNFTTEEWRQYFPNKPYRRTLRKLQFPSDLPAVERKFAQQEECEQ